MSGAFHSWYSLPDLMALAKRGAVLEGSISLARLDRLRGLLHSTDGTASARLAFRLSHDDLLLMELQCDARLELICQRCLEPVVHAISEQVEFAVADAVVSGAALPRGVELITLNGERLQPAALIEDELIVSLPLVPRHGDDLHQEM